MIARFGVFSEVLSMETFFHVLLHTAEDALKLLPFLFLTYLAMEALEHYAGDRTLSAIKKSKKWGPLAGALFGVVPQCGIAGGAANLYVARVISLGTFVSVILATSDEMIPIMLGSDVGGKLFGFVLFKVLYALVCGFIIDAAARFIFKNKKGKAHVSDTEEVGIHDVCEREHCDCHGGIWLPALKHTLRIAVLIFGVSFALGYAVELVGEARLAAWSGGNAALTTLLAALFGFIPNCSVSVILTDFYLEGIVGAGAMMAGLLVNGGVGLLVYFRMNRGKGAWRRDAALCGLLFVLGVVGGFVAELIF